MGWVLLRLSVVLVLCISLSSATPIYDIHSKFPERTEVIFYSIKGDSVEDLKSALKKFGPRDQFGLARFALTRWKISWKVDEITKNITVSYGIRVVLPELRKEGINPTIVSRWNSFSEAIVEHEAQHAHRAVQTAQKIRTALTTLLKYKVKVSQEEINKAAYRLIRENQEWDVEFDRTTAHGKNHGVEL